MWVNVEHNTEEWIEIRSGKLTGSSMGKIMANDGKAFGDPAKKIAVSIAVAQLTGKASINESFSNSHTERGHFQEIEAIEKYQDAMFTSVERDLMYIKGNLACSPDFAIDNRQGIGDIKSVISSTHYNNVKRCDIDPSYKWQFYFNMYLCGSSYFDFVSYCADYPDDKQIYVFRIYPDEKIENRLKARINDFFEVVESVKETIINSEYQLLEPK